MNLTVGMPFRLLHTALFSLFVVAHFPLWLLFYISPSLRQRASWTYRQAVVTTLLKAFLRSFSILQPRSTLSLDPGPEKERFVILEPALSSKYAGNALDGAIKPTHVGATWYPAVYNAHSTGFVVLHFHGGGYLMGDGRSVMCGYLARTLQELAGASFVFCPQYRLASNTSGRFPASLQDAITAYAYLVHTLNIPCDRIVVSGDSAGGHLALMLLRYIVEGASPSLPSPRCAFLFSPWTNLAASLDPVTWTCSPNYHSDYVPARFVTWGARAFFGDSIPEEHPYASPTRYPFRAPCPLFIQTGGLEVLCADNKEFVKQMATIPGNRVEIYIEDDAPHDIVLMGNVMGFEQEAKRCMAKAKAFMNLLGEPAASARP